MTDGQLANMDDEQRAREGERDEALREGERD